MLCDFSLEREFANNNAINMKFAETDEMLEAALHMQLIRRCQRAYLHELRNGLQGISTGIDLLTRMLSGKLPSSVPVDKASDMVRRAIHNYEHAMQAVIDQIIPRGDPLVPFPVAAVVETALSLLSNDAMANGITLNYGSHNPDKNAVAILARKDKFRLALMSLMIRSIDAMSNAQNTREAAASGGTLTIAVQVTDAKISIDICSTPTDSTLLENANLWQLDAATESEAGDAWIAHGIQLLVKNNGGAIEYERIDSALGVTGITRLSFPAATFVA